MTLWMLTHPSAQLHVPLEPPDPWQKIALSLWSQDAKQAHFKNPLWLGAQERGTI